MIIKKLINLFSNKNKLCSDPNKHAPNPEIKSINSKSHIKGYQEYWFDGKSIEPVDSSYDLKKKTILLSKYYSEEFLKGKTFLDLGSASGYFTFTAILSKCKHATAIDIDNAHLDIIRNLAARYNIDNISIISDNIDNYNSKADIVNALSIIHWIYSCTSIFGSMKNMIQHLKNMTNETLFIEWIDPSDEAIKYFKHLDYNKNTIENSYNYENFISELKRNFNSVEELGETRNTRKLFKASI